MTQKVKVKDQDALSESSSDSEDANKHILRVEDEGPFTMPYVTQAELISHMITTPLQRLAAPEIKVFKFLTPKVLCMTPQAYPTRVTNTKVFVGTNGYKEQNDLQSHYRRIMSHKQIL